jgi:hypothetical protein
MGLETIQDPKVRQAVEHLQEHPSWGQFLFHARPFNVRYYAFQNRYVTEAYLLRRAGLDGS